MIPCLRGGLVELWIEGQRLHVQLSSAFVEEIVAVKQTFGEWEQFRQDHAEALPETPPRLHHYLYMSRALPMMVNTDPDNFVRLIESPVRDKFLYCVWDTIGKVLREGIRRIGLHIISGMESYNIL